MKVLPRSFRERPVRSAAAFLWMPQLRLSYRQMSYLGPVLVRTLADVFIAGGLLPRNHPALRTGAPGAQDYGVSEVIGEAWFNLRNTKASPSQYGLFVGVGLMFALIASSLLTFILVVSFGIGTQAQAQLFSHPKGDSSFNAEGTYGLDASKDPFDRAIPAPGGTAGDYGIMMLDKAIRAGANGKGGPLQVATQKLMLTYNTGIMVIASVLVFWMIVTIVVDTAKTGQVGGGRHNMVWAPIRIVFALALLIPLGSNGYSSGQYMVMKLAEWGSNFGSSAWESYVKGVVQASVSKGTPQYAGDVVISYSKMWLCRMAVNSHKGIISRANEYVVEKTATAMRYEGYSDPMGAYQDLTGIPVSKTISFEQEGTRGLCGSITFPIANTPEGGTKLDRAIKQLSNDMGTAYYEELEKIKPRIIDEMCIWAGNHPAFASKALFGENVKESVGEEIYNRAVSGWQKCAVKNGTQFAPSDRSKASMEAIINDYQRGLKTRFDKAYTTFTNNQSSLVDEMTERGWPGMGVYYHRIGQMNTAVYQAQKSSLVVTVGTLQEMDPDKATLWKSIFGSKTEWIGTSQDALNQYEGWWQAPKDDEIVNINTKTVDGKTASVADIKRDPTGALVRQMGFAETNSLIKLLSDDGDLSLSPLAVISSVGDILFWTPLALITAATVANVALAATTGYVSGGAVTIALNEIFHLLTSMLILPMAAGAMLKFYLPLIPFIRVTFSVLTWIISVFEAVVMVPIAALAHLSSQGEGLSGGAADAAWKLWLNILLRPVLTVIGFVGAMLVFNAFASYVNGVFADMYKWQLDESGGLNSLVQWVVFAILYMFIMYTVANTVFKMLDLIPDALSRWYGVPKDVSFDSNNEGAAMMAASNMLSRMSPGKLAVKKKGGGGDGNGAGMNDGGGGDGGGGGGDGGGPPSAPSGGGRIGNAAARRNARR